MKSKETSDILANTSYRRYREEKYKSGQQKFSKFYLKLAVINENPAAKQELINLGNMYQKAGNYKQAIECYKILHFNDKKGFKSKLDLMLYQAVENSNLENVRFMIQSGANLKIQSKLSESSPHGIGDFLYPDLPSSIMPGHGLLHLACYKDNVQMVNLLLNLGAPLFEKNRFNKTPRDANENCFDKAWLMMHNEMLYKSGLLYFMAIDEGIPLLPKNICEQVAENLIKSTCEKLNISMNTYKQLTEQAEISLILNSIQDKYLELWENDQSQALFKSYSVVSGYPNSPTIQDIIANAFKNVNQFYSSTLNLFRQEDRTLRALKELNYITKDNQLNDAAPQKFKEEFNLIYSQSALNP